MAHFTAVAGPMTGGISRIVMILPSVRPEDSTQAKQRLDAGWPVSQKISTCLAEDLEDLEMGS